MQFCTEKYRWTKFISMQNQYGLTYREEEREMNRFCNETGVGMILVRLFVYFAAWAQALTARIMEST